jgi:parallel beta-helix repeat protein
MRELAWRVERRKWLSAMIALTFCFSAMLTLLVTCSSDGTDTAVRECPVGNGLIPVRTLALTVHDPIPIDGNAGFTGPNASTGITRGSGTESDPYVIEGWEITSFPANGIEITNADVHFVIQDCYVHDGQGWGAAIYLYSCYNGIVRNCTCSFNFNGTGIYSMGGGNSLLNNSCLDNNVGIYLRSGANTMSNNNVHNNYFGVEMAWIWPCQVTENNVSQNLCGFSMENCQGVTLRGNNISDNEFWGLMLRDCTDLSLWSNVFVSDGIQMAWSELPYLDCHTITQNNTVNGNPVLYFKNCNGLQLDGMQTGQLIVVNCTDVGITNLTIGDTDSGIQMAYVSNATVALNNVSDNDYGMVVHSCTGIRIEGNIAINNDYGLNARGLIDSSIADNNVVDADNEAITLRSCQNTSVSGNSVVSSDDYGLYVRECENTTVIMNSIQGNAYGTLAYSCFNTTIIGNSFAGNDNGITFRYCTDDTVTSNNVSNNDVGIYLESSSNNHLVNNTCRGNEVGVGLLDSDTNDVIGNLISQSVYYGIYVVSGSLNAIFDNSFCDNNGAGESYDPSHIQACDDGSVNWWNSSDTGNYWSDWTTPDSIAPFGVVDVPYEIDGGAGAKDYYPLTLLVDKPPSASFTVSPLNGPVGMIFSVDASSSTDFEDDAGLLEVRWDWEDDGTWDTDWTSEKTAVHQYSMPGDYTIRLEVIDTGLLSDQATAQVLVVDDGNPSTSAQLSGILGEDGWYLCEVEVLLEADDEWSSIDCTQFRIDESDWQDYSAPFEIFEDGIHTLEYFSEDSAGNVEDVQSTQIKIDCTAPLLDITTENGTVFDTDVVNITLTCSDPCSGVDCVEYSLDNGEYVVCGSETCIQLSDLSNGTHQLSVRIHDQAGNEATQELTFEVSIATDDVDGDEDTLADTSSYWLTVGAIAAVVVAVLVIVAFLMRRKGQ